MSYVGKAPIDRTLGISQKNVFTGDGSTVNFDMTTAAPDGGDTAVDVFIDNVRQEPGTGKAYVLAQVSDEWKRITFTTAPASGAVIWVLNRLRTQITNILPGDNTVSTAMIQDNAVTGTKIALGSDAQGDFMYYNGTDWVRLPAGTSGEAILSGGSGANPTWGSAGDFKNGGDAGGAARTLGNTDDYSLGFNRPTPDKGFDIYGGKGKYNNIIHLSHNGLKGSGEFEYLTSKATADEIFFFPDSANLHTNTFAISDFMTEDKTASEGSSSNKSASSTPTETMKIPDFLDCTITANAKTVIYDNLNLKNVKGQLVIKDQNASLKNPYFQNSHQTSDSLLSLLKI